MNNKEGKIKAKVVSYFWPNLLFDLCLYYEIKL